MSRRDDNRDLFGFKSLGELTAKVAPKRPSRVQQRLIDASAEISLSPAGFWNLGRSFPVAVSLCWTGKRKDARAGRDAEVYRDIEKLDL